MVLTSWPEFVILDINEAWVQLHGISRREAIGKTPFQLRLVDHSVPNAEIERALGAEGWVRDLEVCVPLWDGSERVLLWSARLFQVEEGQQMISSFVDITERKKAAQALKASEARFRKAFEVNPDGMVLARVEDGAVLADNQEMVSLSGYTVGELAGRSSFSEPVGFWFHPEDRVRLLQAVRAEGKALIESVFRRKDGSLFDGAISSVIVELEGQECLLSVVRDITEQKRSQQEVRDREAQFRNLFEHLFSGFVLVGGVSHGDEKPREHCLLLANSEAERMTGLNWYQAERASDPLSVLMDTELLERCDQVAQGAAPFRVEHFSPTLQRFFEIQAYSPQIGQFALVFNDTTQRKHVEEALKLKDFVFHSSLAANSITNLEGCVTEVNAAFLQIWGYATPEEVLGRHIVHFFAEAEEAEPVRESMRVHGAWKGNFTARRKDGSTFLAHAFGASVRDEAGNWLGYQSSVIDVTAQAQAHAAMLDSERRLRSLFEGSPIGMFRSTLEGRFLLVNPAMASIFRYEGPEAMVQAINGLGIPDALYESPAHRSELLTRLMSRPSEWLVEEIHFRRADGTFMDGIMSIRLWLDPDTRQEALFGFVQDISERKQMELELRRSQQWLEAAIAQSPLGIVIAEGPDLEVKLVNRAAKEIFSLMPSSINQWEVFRKEGLLLPPEERPLARAIQAGVCTLGEEVFFASEDGRQRWLLINAAPLLDSDQRVTSGIAILQDITEQKHSELEIKNLKTYLSNILDSMPSAMIALDEQGRVTQWNRQAEVMAEIRTEDALGQGLRTLLPGFAPWIEPLRQEALREVHPAHFGNVLQEIGGERHFYNVTVFPVIGSTPMGTVVHLENVTERSRIQELMIQTEKMMSVGGLAAGMAHEINNPLGIISQAAQNIERRISPALPANQATAQALGLDLQVLASYYEQRRIPEFITSIQDAVARASRIIHNMLQFSRTPESTRTWVFLADVLQQTLDLASNDYDLKKKYNFRGIQIQQDIEPGLPRIFVVVVELEQVILNLLRNAAQAMAGNPPNRPACLGIRLCREGAYVVLSIRDNGPGMDEATRRRIFEPFFTTKAPGVGTGLGLSVSFMIITQNHKGLLEVESSPGKGSCFTMRLPIEEGGGHA